MYLCVCTQANWSSPTLNGDNSQLHNFQSVHKPSGANNTRFTCIGCSAQGRYGMINLAVEFNQIWLGNHNCASMISLRIYIILASIAESFANEERCVMLRLLTLWRSSRVDVLFSISVKTLALGGWLTKQQIAQNHISTYKGIFMLGNCLSWC